MKQEELDGNASNPGTPRSCMLHALLRIWTRMILVSSAISYVVDCMRYGMQFCSF